MSKKAKKGSEDSKKQLEKSMEGLNPKKEVNESEERDQSQNVSFNKNDTSAIESNLNKSNTKPSKSKGSKNIRDSVEGDEREEEEEREEHNQENEDFHDEEEAQEYVQYEKDYQEMESKNQSMIQGKKNKEAPWMAYDFLFPAGILAKLVGLYI
jgi:hypothetical protein